MRYWGFFSFLLLGLISCGDDPITIALCPARLASDPTTSPPSGWSLVEYDGDTLTVAGTYYVRDKPLITEWSIIALKIASQPEGSKAAVVRLNEYAIRNLKKFSSTPANLKNPLALQINGRWASFTPLLEVTSDRITLRGFTPKETEQLERYVATK